MRPLRADRATSASYAAGTRRGVVHAAPPPARDAERIPVICCIRLDHLGAVACDGGLARCAVTRTAATSRLASTVWRVTNAMVRSTGR